MHKNNPFIIRKTKPRKGISRSPIQLSGEELARELGPRYQTIDVRIGNQRMVLDIAQGTWIHGNFQSTDHILFSLLLSFQKKRKLTLTIWPH
jgi:hypothetical protein